MGQLTESRPARPPFIQAWRTETARWFADADIIPRRGMDFGGRMHHVQWGEMRASRIEVESHVVNRTTSHVQSSRSNEVVLALVMSGSSTIVQDGRSVQLQPGEASVYDTSRPYTLVFDEPLSGIGVRFPAGLLPVGPAVLADLTATLMPAHEPVTSYALQTIDSTIQTFDRLPLLAREHAAHMLNDAFAMACLGHAERLGLLEPATESDRLSEILRYAEDNLGDPALSPARIAEAHYMSVRNVHRLAAERNIRLGSWIRRQRLARCRDELCDPALRSVPVAEIGARWCFANAAHFSTTFRAEYGVTPSEYRRTNLGV
jgi:AraC-like DNA-binding protein